MPTATMADAGSRRSITARTRVAGTVCSSAKRRRAEKKATRSHWFGTQCHGNDEGYLQ